MALDGRLDAFGRHRQQTVEGIVGRREQPAQRLLAAVGDLQELRPVAQPVGITVELVDAVGGHQGQLDEEVVAPLQAPSVDQARHRALDRLAEPMGFR